MQQQAVAAYLQVARRTGSPRDIEANLLSRSATQLQRISDNWDNAQPELLAALKLSAVTRDDSPLPAPIRHIAMFISRAPLC